VIGVADAEEAGGTIERNGKNEDRTAIARMMVAAFFKHLIMNRLDSQC
jgi:hypothetical protein